MAFTLKTVECTTNEHASFGEIKKSILKAAKAAEKTGRHDKLVIELPQGKNTLTETFKLSAKENPELKHVDVTLRAKIAGTAELNSLVRLDGSLFTPVEGTDYHLYKFKKQKGSYPLFHDFFLNFKRIPMAKSDAWRNLDPLTDDERSGKSKREGFWVPIETAKKLASASIGATELVMYVEWLFVILHVARVDLSKTREENGETYALVELREGEMDHFCAKFPRHLNIGNREMFFQNAPAFITRNTFAYDYYSGKLYLNAEHPEYLWCHALEYPALETLVEVEGLENFTVENVEFTGTTSKYGCENVYLCDQANTVFRPGKNSRLETAAILAREVRGLSVTGCVFRSLGTNGVQVVDKSVRTVIAGNRFLDVSMSGILVGNPSSAWDEKNRSYNVRIENNRLSHIGYEFPACVAIYVSTVDGLKILHNTVEDCAYTAVSVGWIWRPGEYALGEKINVRDAEIAYNYFHNFMQLLKDGGAVYVLGGNCDRTLRDDRFNRVHDNFAILDTLVKRYGKYGYYCDGAASNWEVAHNVVINVDGMPIFSQPYPRALSYHNTFLDIYSNTPRHVTTSVPARDIVTVDYHLVEGDADALLEAFPEARKIRDAAGSDLI